MRSGEVIGSRTEKKGRSLIVARDDHGPEKKGRSLICWRARAKSGSVPLFLGLVLLVIGVAMQERWSVERADELFRRRAVFDEYCFDHAMSSEACTGNPYAEI